MKKEEGYGISEELQQKGISYFLKHQDQWVTRKELQDSLGIGKTQAYRLCIVLSTRIHLIEKEHHNEFSNSKLSMMLESEFVKQAGEELCAISTLTDDDRQLLSMLINMAESSRAFGNKLQTLKRHLSASRFLLNGLVPVFSAATEMRNVPKKAQEALVVLLQAIELKKSVWLTYKAPNVEKEKSYTINPVGVFNQYGNLYLCSYSPYYRNSVVHAVSRIISAVINEDKKADTPDGFRDLSCIIDPFGIAIDVPVTTVVVWIAPEQAFYEKEKSWPNGTIIENHSDGSITITVKTRNIWGCKHWVMGMGSTAKCISPDELKQEILNEYRKCSNNL